MNQLLDEEIALSNGDYIHNQPEQLKIMCPFCNAPYDADMETSFDYSMGSEYTGIYGEEVGVKIFCKNCKRLVYRKND